MHVAHGRGSVLLCQYFNTLCTSGFMVDDMFSYNGLYDATIVASLQCCARANTPAAWYWLHPVLDFGRRQD